MNPDAAPKLNPWPFIAGDLALLGVAGTIAYQASPALTGVPLLAVVACVALGAICSIIPFLINYARRQEIFLVERQNEIVALAQTTATSAEQLSIAAASLHGIAETSARTLKHAEQLPHKLQEKINEFKTQINEVSATDNEALSQEVNTLRTGETERLEAALTAIRKIASELAALEAANRKHIAEFKHSLETFSTAVRRAATDGSAALSTAQSNAVSAIENALQKAVADIEGRFPSLPENDPTAARSPSRRHHPESDSTPSAPPTPASPPSHREAADSADSPASSLDASIVDLPEDEAAGGPRSEGTVAVAAKPLVARKRPPKRASSNETELSLAFESEAATAASPDGLTRLLVTAYIGIGNKLYVRGDGPGLNWEKGTPLQFVSIGKWRWETADAAGPLTIKLLKNDEHECNIGALTIDPGHQCEVTANF